MTARTDAVLKIVEAVVEEAQEHEEAGERQQSIEKYKLAAETIQSVVDSIKELNDEEIQIFNEHIDEWLERARIQQTVESSKPKPIEKGEQRRGAAAVGAVAGMAAGGMIGLPIIGLAAGAVTAANSMDREDAIGKGARALGKAGAKAIREAERINKKYDLSGKLKKAAISAAKGAAALNKKHDITGKAYEAGKAAGSAAVKLNEEHDITGKVAHAGKAAIETAEELNEEYDLTGRASKVAAKAKEVNAKNNITGKVQQAAQKAGKLTVEATTKLIDRE